MADGGGQDLLVIGRELALDAKAESTRRSYRSLVSEFETVATANNVDVHNPGEDGMLIWIAHRFQTQRGASVANAVSAVRDTLSQQAADRTRTKRVADAIEGAVRRTAERAAAGKEDAGADERQPLPPWVLQRFVDLGPASEDGMIWRRDAALVALGLRTLRRPSELAALKWSDIQQRGELLWVTIRKSKTDQRRSGFSIPLERSASKYCAVTLLEEWRRAQTPASATVFTTVLGKDMTTSSISAVVKRVARAVGFEEKVSGHSLRIGGATALLSAGVSSENIQALGGWSSSAFQRYARTTELAASRIASRMGL